MRDVELTPLALVSSVKYPMNTTHKNSTHKGSMADIET